ncbi:MAG TPA: GNAT family N-acetyltransferase [Candidatus Saccharimonadales bacterium]|nr:GNAT family N-acetyltransferase [Candidatus Saccharimonadales bacterium]
MIIRTAAPEDAKVIHTLGEAVSEFATGRDTVTFWPEGILKAAVQDATVIILVAEVGQEITGFIIANCNKPLSKALIENIYVQPAYRGQGIGTALVQALIKEAKTRGYEYIAVLTPPDDTPAIKTYEKVGFMPGETFLWLDYNESEQFKKEGA